MTKIKVALIISFVVLGSVSLVQAQTTVAINPGTQYQTFRGWGTLFPQDLSVSDRLTKQIVDIGVNDLGVNCFRYEPPMGWSPETRRWEWENDDADALHTEPSALSTNDLDERVRKWVLPAKQAIEANGDRMYVQISPSFYDTGSSGEAFPWFLRSPGEYVEYAMSVIQQLKEGHGIEPDTYTICNEPQYNNAFSESITLKMAKALGRRMQEAGLRTGIQYPESMSDASAIVWLQNAQNDPELWKYVKTVSYHLYGPRTNLEGIRDIALAKGLPTAQTEFLAGNSLADDYLYDDMTLGQVSEWHVYGQALPVPFANGTSFDRKQHYWLFRQFMPYVRPGAVRIDAVSGDSTVRPLAFTKNGETTVLLINTSGGSSNQTVTLSGLPNGEYGICQSISEALPTELGIQPVTNGLLNVYLAKNAFVTVYPHNAGNLAPLVLQWQSADAYLKLGVSSTTTLSVDAMDPELDALSYQWSMVTNPLGASVVFATPTNKSCAVSGLTAEGEYVFAVTVSDATHSKTREVLLKVFNGNQPPILFDVHQRIPIRIIQPANSTTLRSAAKDVEGSACTFLWSIVTQPSGASALLLTPTNSGCIITNLNILGDYTVRITANDGTDSSSQDLSFTVYPQDVNPPVISNLSGTLNGNGSGHLSAITSDADGDWISHWWEQTSGPTNARTYFSAQSSPVSEVYADTAGTYQFRLDAVGPNQYAYSSTVTLTLSNTAAPFAGFTVSPSSGWVPLTATFTDTSSGTVTNRYWDFGDGFTTNTSAASIAHVYTAAGTSTVTLIVSGPTGMSTNTQTDCIRALPSVPPSAGFTLTPASGAAPLTVAFTDTSTGSITNRFWDFGDGFTTNAAGTGIAHIYSSAGTYAVQLIVSGPLGISTSTQFNAVTVAPPIPPSAGFTASLTNGTSPLAVTFTDLSTGSITNRYWDFGDGTTSNTAAATVVSHTYTSAGTNTVTLIVSGPAGSSTNIQTGLIRVAAGAIASLYKYEGFNYTADTGLRYQPGYSVTGSGGMATNRAGSLTYPGLPDSVGGKLQIYGQRPASAGTVNYFLWTGGVPTGDNVTNLFASFILNVANVGTIQSNQYIFAIRNASGQIMITNNASNPAKFNIGIFQQVGKTVWAWDTNGGNGYDINTPYFIVVSYTNTTSSTYNSQVWINPALTATSCPPNIGIAEIYNSSPTNYFGFGNGNGNPAAGTVIYVDELRYGSTWASVVPSASAPVSAPVITSALLATGTVGQAFSYQIAADNTPTSFNATGLPSGLNVDTNSGAISGTPAAAGSNDVTISASNAGGTDSKTLAIVISPVPVDANGNGIPDAWENQHGIINCNPNDPASNGINTILECYIAGLNPTSPSARFGLSVQQAAAQRLLQWTAVSGRVYSVYWTTNLLNGFQPMETNIVWPQNSWTGTVSGSQGGDFYRLKVRLGP